MYNELLSLYIFIILGILVLTLVLIQLPTAEGVNECLDSSLNNCSSTADGGICIDTTDGFICDCREGFILIPNNSICERECSSYHNL